MEITLYDIGKDYLLPLVLGGIGAGIAWKIFVSETRRDRKREIKNKKEEQEDKVFYFASLLENSLAISREQNNHIKLFIEGSKKDPTNINQIPWVPLNDIKRISKQINVEEYLLSYISVFKSDRKELVNEFKNIIALVDYLDSQFDQIPRRLKFSSDFILEKQHDFQRTFKEAYKITGDLMFYYNNHNLVLAAKLSKIIGDMNASTEGKETDMKLFIDNFLVPIQDFCSDMLTTSKENTFEIQKLLHLTREGQTIYKQIMVQVDGTIATLVRDHEKIDGVLKTLVKLSERILRLYLK